MSIVDAAVARWRDTVERTGAPVATALAALMVAVTALQYLVLPAVGVPADGSLQHQLFYFDTEHPTRLWTLATSAFAHGGVLHLAFTVYLVVGFGSLIEPRYGGYPVLVAFAAGAAGALGSGLLLHAVAGGASQYVGASGGAFGLLGWLAGHEPDRRLPTFPPGPALLVAGFVATVSVGVVIVFGTSAFGIAHIPHVGAVLAGAIVGLLFR